jgi:hypothetical protein
MADGAPGHHAAQGADAVLDNEQPGVPPPQLGDVRERVAECVVHKEDQISDTHATKARLQLAGVHVERVAIDVNVDYLLSGTHGRTGHGRAYKGWQDHRESLLLP